MIKSMKKEFIVHEVYVRSYTKNYLDKQSFNDDLDYIACKIKKELGNFTTIKTKEWKKQCSSTKAFTRRLNENGDYPMFKHFINGIQDDLLFSSSLDDILKYENPNLDLSYLLKDKYESQVKYFYRLLQDDKVNGTLNNYYFDFKEYEDMYRECEKVADANIRRYKRLIKRILNQALENVDYSYDNQQIVKFINTKIGWLFSEEKSKLPSHKEHLKKNSEIIDGGYIRSKRMHCLQKWFGLNGMFDYEIEQLDFLTNSQKDFILSTLKVCSELSIKINKSHEIDLSKKELGDKLGLSLYAIDKKIVRIREKVKKNGIEVIKYYNTYTNTATRTKFKAMDKKEMIDNMYYTEEYDNNYDYSLYEPKEEIDYYIEEQGYNNKYNYNYNTYR